MLTSLPILLILEPGSAGFLEGGAFLSSPRAATAMEHPLGTLEALPIPFSKHSAVQWERHSVNKTLQPSTHFTNIYQVSVMWFGTALSVGNILVNKKASFLPLWNLDWSSFMSFSCVTFTLDAPGPDSSSGIQGQRCKPPGVLNWVAYGMMPGTAWHILGIQKPLIDTKKFSILTWNSWESPQADGHNITAQSDSSWGFVILPENIQSREIPRLWKKGKYKPFYVVPCLIYFQLCLKWYLSPLYMKWKISNEDWNSLWISQVHKSAPRGLPSTLVGHYCPHV